MSKSNVKQQTKQTPILTADNSGLRSIINLNQAINHVINKHAMTCNSGETLSPRSVLEQRALSGLAIALEDKRRPWLRTSDELRRRAVLEAGSSKHMDVTTNKRRGNGDTIQDSAPNSYGSLPESQNGSRGYWSEEMMMTTNSRSRSSSSLGNSIFYYGEDDNLTPSVHDVDDEGPSFPCMKEEDFLKCCFFCKSSLSMGKDIFMYRGDRAFCSAECRYQQIVIDECNGSPSQA